MGMIYEALGECAEVGFEPWALPPKLRDTHSSDLLCTSPASAASPLRLWLGGEPMLPSCAFIQQPQSVSSVSAWLAAYGKTALIPTVATLAAR